MLGMDGLQAHERHEPPPLDFAPRVGETEIEDAAKADGKAGPGTFAPPEAESPAVASETAQASLPLAPPVHRGLAPEQLDRLKSALSELEACRRLLDKALEGGR